MSEIPSTDVGARLSKEHRDLWVKCILAAGFGTYQDRQAFVDGYTLQPLAKLATEGMSRRYEVGRRAHLLLNSKVSTPNEEVGDHIGDER